MKFADIPGHAEVKKRLRAMADSGRIPHALLLEGPPGTGKYALARAFAQYVHCENRTPDGDSCGRCPSCQQHEAFNQIDTYFSYPVVKKGSDSPTSEEYVHEFQELLAENQYMDFESWLLKLDNINAQPLIYVSEANSLIRKLSLTAHSAKYKIVLMWLPERLKEDTANKLLKLVEEPDADTIFVMASDNSRQILPTIYSRTQRIGVKRYTDEEVADILCRDYGLDSVQAQQIARLAAGNVTEAIKLISLSKESGQYLDLFMDLMRKAYTRNVGELKAWAAEVATLGREREIKFLEYCARMIRENFILNLRNPELTYLNQAELNFSSRFSPFINERNVLKLFKILTDAKADIAANANAKLVNFDVALKTILLLKQ